MLFGSTHVERSGGRIAERCPICGRETSCHLIRVGESRAILGFPTGEGELVRWEIECGECGVVVDRARLPDPEGIDREGHLRGALDALEGMLAKHRPGWLGKLAGAIVLVLCAVGMAVIVRLFKVGDWLAAIGMLLAGCLAIVAWTLIAIGWRFRARRAYAREALEPLLIRAWSPLAPTPAEIEAQLKAARRDGLALPHLLDRERIRGAL